MTCRTLKHFALVTTCLLNIYSPSVRELVFDNHWSVTLMAMVALDVLLGTTGGDGYVLDGWGEPEGGHRWAIGQTSRLRLPVSARGKAHVVVLDMIPWIRPPHVFQQRIVVGLNGRLVGTFSITHHMALGLPVPEALTLAGEIIVSIDHLDAPTNREFDTYQDGNSMNLMVLGVRLFRVTPRPTTPPVQLAPVTVSVDEKESLLSRFESLGHRCAFGLFQRRWGIDRHDLLRFVGVQTPILVRELLNDFEGLGTESDLHAFIREDNRGLYSLYDRVRQMWFNTSQPIDTTTPAAVVRLAGRRLRFLRRKFLEDMALGMRTFVVNSPYHIIDAEGLALHIALNVKARNSLLWTNQTGALPPGTVRRLGAGMYYGQLDTLGAVEGDPSDAAWFSVCKNTLTLLEEERKT